MWKIAVGFIIFAALALYMLSRGGDIDLGGEKHGRLEQHDLVAFDLKMIKSTHQRTHIG